MRGCMMETPDASDNPAAIPIGGGLPDPPQILKNIEG